MNFFEFHKTIIQSSTDTVKKLAVLNPLTIHRKGKKTKAIFALVLVCFFWGTTWIASKEGVRHMPALQMAGIRQIIAGLLYVSFFLYKGLPLPKGKEWGPVLILSFLNFAMSNGLSTWGVQYISAGLGSIMGSFFGAAFIVLLPIGLNQLLPVVAGWVGIGVSTAGIAHAELIVFGTLIVWFLIVEPHGLAKLWSTGKQKLRLWPVPH